MKAVKAFSQLGQRTDKAFNKLGDKANSTLDKVKNVGGQLNQGFVSIKNGVNKIPDLNEKAMGLVDKVVQKSGQATNVLRKASAIGDRILTGAVQLGGNNVPVLGSALLAGQKAMGGLHTGAVKLDAARDKAAKDLHKYSEVSRDTIGDIEKINQRKKMQLAVMPHDEHPSFV